MTWRAGDQSSQPGCGRYSGTRVTGVVAVVAGHRFIPAVAVHPHGGVRKAAPHTPRMESDEAAAASGAERGGWSGE